jgi:2-methylisocitrate lyase-like PEP mutase family enzyme
MADPQLKAALRSGETILAPGVFDGISALIADGMGFGALYVTGYGVVASHLGLPDAGLATYSDMLERVALITSRTTTPVIADADTGYGGLLNVRETVRGYERAGVSAIQLEDQEFPKRCGHTPGRRVVPLKDMLAKIAVAVESRSSDDLLVIARTDARTGHGLDEAIRRGRAFAEAGADVVFIESPESEEELARIREAVDAPLLANMVNGGSTPLLSRDRLRALGYAVAIWPAAGFLAAGAGLERAFADLLENGATTGVAELYPFDAFSRLVGFEDVWDFERRHAERSASLAAK